MQSENTFLFLDSADRFDALEYSKRQQTFKQKFILKVVFFFSFFLFSFLLFLTGAARCFNSQEKQLKAGRGLTYTQWSKIDERHPAWTNHSTQGEASQQTWKVQEAMTGQMVWKMLLMNDEEKKKVVAPFTLYPLCPVLLTLHPAAQSTQSNVLWFCKSRICHVYARTPSCQEVDGVSSEIVRNWIVLTWCRDIFQPCLRQQHKALLGSLQDILPQRSCIFLTRCQDIFQLCLGATV